MGDCLVEDLAQANFNRLLQRVRRILRRDYAFPKGESTFPGGGGGGGGGGGKTSNNNSGKNKGGTDGAEAGASGAKKDASSSKGKIGKKKKSKKARGGKFGVKCVYAPENANHFTSGAGVKGRGGIGCDGVGGSAVFVTG
jgi:tRNA A37 threonylcarbamoyladenosine dehydratase